MTLKGKGGQLSVVRETYGTGLMSSHYWESREVEKGVAAIILGHCKLSLLFVIDLPFKVFF